MKIILLKGGSKYTDFIINTQFGLIRRLLNLKHDGLIYRLDPDNSEISPGKQGCMLQRRFGSEKLTGIQEKFQIVFRASEA